MSLNKPTKRQLFVGNKLDIVGEMGGYIGTAVLIKRAPSRLIADNLPYVRYEKVNESQEPTMWIWAKERWLVSWVKHPYYRAGDKSCIHVPYFLKRSTDHPSHVDYNQIGNRGVALSNCYIFLEEEGVLTLDGENYLPEAIRALKRIKKAMDGEIIIFSHNPVQVKERWELNKLGYRIFDFLPTDKTFAEAVQDYIDLIEIDDKVEDYTILSGVSRVQGSRVVQCNLKTGLKLKKK